MSLGTRIRDARIQRGMTQKQLVGDHITRNMLSKIENGSATPSVRTLEYLAAKLELPVGYFMNDAIYSDGTSPDGLDEMRAAYRAGEYVRCIQLLEETPAVATTDEGYLLYTRAAIAAARQALDAGDYDAAKTYADMADYYNKESLYYSPATDAEMSLILAECSLVLDLSEYPENAREYNRSIQAISFSQRFALSQGEYLLKQGDLEGAAAILEPMEEAEPGLRARQLYLLGRLHAQQGKEDALELLLAAEAQETANPRLRRGIYARLEKVYLAAEDFKMAHHYAALQIEDTTL